MQEYIKKILGPGATTLIISNEQMKDIIKLVKSVEGFCLLIKCVGISIQNEAKGLKRGFIDIL